MKKALSMSDQIFTSAFENASMGIGITGLDGKWKRVNQSLCKMLGYSKEELLTKSFAEITCSDDKTADLAAYRRFLNGEIQGYRREKRYLHKQGHVVWAQVSVCVVPDSGHKPFLFISNIQDITERKNSEAAMHESLDSFRILSEIMPQLVWNTSVDGFATYYNQANDAIIMLSLDGEIQTWNKGAERLYGWTSAETVGHKDIDLYDKSSEVYLEMIRCLLRDDHWEGELCHRTCSGAMVYVESRLTLTRDHINEAKSILVINTDITEKRRNQIQVLRSQRLESIGTLAGGIAHDLR